MKTARYAWEALSFAEKSWNAPVCEKCDKLAKLYERTPETNYDYWLMTELFYLLHNGDVCKEGSDEGSN